jgi:HEAT repeat protein
MRLVVITVLVASNAFAQAPADSINHIVDSLFVRASSISVYYSNLVQPAKQSLSLMGESAVPRLIERTTTQVAREMQTLEDVFKLIGHPAVPGLVDALGSNDVYRRRLAARILGEMADTASVDGLLRFTRDSDFRMRAGVISALGKAADSRAVAPALMALDDSDYLVRTAATVALSNLKNPGTVAALIKALSDPYYGVRYSAAAALAKIGAPSIEPLLNALRKPADSIAYYLSIEVSGDLSDSRFIGPLSVIINSDDFCARALAAEALGKIGTKPAYDVLHKRYEIETHPLVISKIEAVVLK